MGVLALLVSCPNPIPVNLASQVSDDVGPVMTVTSPEAGATYRQSVTVAGTVVDEGGEVSELMVRVAELGLEQRVDVGTDGSFSHQVATADLAETLGFTLIATDWNGNRSETSFQIAPNTEGPIFTITSPNDEGEYASSIMLRGSVTDNDSVVETVALEVKAADVEEALAVAADGTFAYDLDATGITKTIVITITASDAKGNQSTLERTLFNDGEGPHIIITEPANFSAYGTVVRVAGSVTDAEGVATTDEVASVSYEVAGTAVAGDITPDANGAFSFVFATRLADGTEVVSGAAAIELMATDWNGNLSTESVTIVRSETGDFDAVTVTPGDRQVTIAWDPVLYAESYCIRELNDGLSMEDASSPAVWEGLENGELYSFQLSAVIPDGVGPDAVSATFDTIPLSPRSLAPRVRQVDHRSITIEWRGFSKIPGYTVERSLDPNGPWEVRARHGETVLEDTRVAYDTDYWYRVRPQAYSTVVSDPVRAVPGRFCYGIVAAAPTNAAANQVYATGSRVYVACGDGGLTIMEVIGDELVFRGSLDTPGYARDVVADEPYVYVADDEGGVRVIDVSSFAAPFEAASLATEYDAKGLTLSGTELFVAVANAGLEAIDVSTPGSPESIVYTPRAGGHGRDVALLGSYAYLTRGYAGLQIFDIDPVAESHYETGWFTNDPTGVAASGQHVFVVTSNAYLYSLDVSDPPNPSALGPFTLAGDGYGVAVRDGRAYVACDTAGLELWDVSDPGAPVSIHVCNTPGRAQGVAVEGSYAFVADQDAGVQMINVAEPNDMSVVSARGVLGTYDYQDFAYDGRYAYVAAANEGLVIVDPAGGANFYETVGVCPLDGIGADVAVDGDYAYVAARNGGFHVVDVSDPTDPIHISSLPTTGDAWDVAVSGPFAYLTVNGAGLIVIDIRDPGTPVVVGECSLTVPAYPRVLLSAGFAYVTDQSSGFHVVDLSDPAAPVARGSWSGGSMLMGTDVHGDYAYVADQSGQLHVLDLGDPDNPDDIATVPTASDAWDVAVDGRYAYVAVYEAGVEVFDVSDPTTPTQVMTSPYAEEDFRVAARIIVEGNSVYKIGGSAILRYRIWSDL